MEKKLFVLSMWKLTLGSGIAFVGCAQKEETKRLPHLCKDMGNSCFWSILNQCGSDNYL
jgi:hypothetical protein